jgi:hypothetical protein
MCGGGGNPVSDIIDTGGDLLSGAGDIVGGALDTAGNIVDTAVQTVADNPELAAIVAIATGQPELLGADAFTAEELASAAEAAAGTEYGTETAAALTDYGAGTAASGIDSIPLNAFDGPTLPTDLPFDGPTIPSDVPYDGPTPTSATSGVDQPFDGPTLKDPSIFDKFTGGIKNIIPSSTTLSNVFDSLGKVAPLAGAGILGKLAYADQARINDSIVKAYNDYLSQQAGIRSGYGVTAGPQLLNYTRNATPLAQAPLRTVADVVNIPKKADGGSMNDLYNEYAMLNNRMRNYRKFAKGGLI